MSHRHGSESIGRVSNASSRDMCDNHDDIGGRSTAKSQLKKRNIPTFQFAHTVREDHGSELYDCSFNPYVADDEEPLFATVGNCRATVYKCLNDGSFKAIYCFMDPDADIFYACTWLYDTQADSHVLAIGGKRSVIHVIPFGGEAGINDFVGHGQAVNELMTHPTDSCLLLSGGKDYELRLWNVQNGVCIAIFGGLGGHKSEVLTCDFDLLGERIVSGGMDHCIKIWSILENHHVDKGIQLSKIFVPELNTQSFETVKVNQPDFSTLDVHKNYVDCVRWLGDTLISKSCEETICHWKPGSQRDMDFSRGETNVSLLRRCRLPNCTVWFMKFAIDPKFKWLAAGNQPGKIYVWDLNALSAAPKIFHHPKCTTPIRQVAFSPDGETLIAVCDDASIWHWRQKKT